MRPASPEAIKPTDTPQQIARDLGANVVLTGSMQRAGERLRVAYEVIDVTRNSEFGKRRIGFGPLATKDFDERAVPILAKVLGNDARKQVNHNSR